MNKFASSADRDLIKRIDDACASVETAKATYFDRSVALGRLLIEAKQRHPAIADFQAFLKQTKVGINLRWAYECITMAGDPKEAERLRTANKERVKKHREKKRLKKPEPEPEPEPKRRKHGAKWFLSQFRDACDTCLIELNLEEADKIYATARRRAEKIKAIIKEAA